MEFFAMCRRAPGLRGLLPVGLGLCLTPAALGLTCPGDLSGDAIVNGADLAQLLGQWSGAGPADLNGDGVVNGADLAALLGAWGACQALVYEVPLVPTEAFQIGLELLGDSGPLFPPADIQVRINQDLIAIRDAIPALASQTHSPAWLANRIIISIDLAADQQPIECLDAFFSGDQALLFSNIFTVTFPGPINVLAVAAQYAATPGVNFAEPDALIGGQNTWSPAPTPSGVWRWTIDDGFLDCFDGCDCHQVYVLDTTPEGQVTQISFEQFGAPWCTFGK